VLDGCAVLFAQFRQSGHRGALIKVLVQCPFGTAAISLERECLMLISQLPRPQTLEASASPLAAPDPRWPVSLKQDHRIEFALCNQLSKRASR